jgi:hypothetical protein
MGSEDVEEVGDDTAPDKHAGLLRRVRASHCTHLEFGSLPMGVLDPLRVHCML